MIRRHPDVCALLALGVFLTIGAPPDAPLAALQVRMASVTEGAADRAGSLRDRFEERRLRVWQRLDERLRALEERIEAQDQRRRARVVRVVRT
jgi:hypothetical protein